MRLTLSRIRCPCVHACIIGDPIPASNPDLGSPPRGDGLLRRPGASRLPGTPDPTFLMVAPCGHDLPHPQRAQRLEFVRPDGSYPPHIDGAPTQPSQCSPRTTSPPPSTELLGRHGLQDSTNGNDIGGATSRARRLGIITYILRNIAHHILTARHFAAAAARRLLPPALDAALALLTTSRQLRGVSRADMARRQGETSRVGTTPHTPHTAHTHSGSHTAAGTQPRRRGRRGSGACRRSRQAVAE